MTNRHTLIALVFALLVPGWLWLRSKCPESAKGFGAIWTALPI